jgi:hypothetical protein
LGVRAGPTRPKLGISGRIGRIALSSIRSAVFKRWLWQPTQY